MKLHVLTRKSLGGIETDLSGRALGADGEPVPGLYAAGEASGFGGGGVHGYRALEGTFVGGCLFSGRAAGSRRRLRPSERQRRHAPVDPSRGLSPVAHRSPHDHVPACEADAGP